MATQWFCILKQQCVLWMEFLSRSQPGYRKVRNVHVQAYFKYFHFWCARFIRPVPWRLFQLNRRVSLRFVFYRQVRVLHEMKRPLTEHMKHIGASDHVTQIGSLV